MTYWLVIGLCMYTRLGAILLHPDPSSGTLTYVAALSLRTQSVDTLSGHGRPGDPRYRSDDIEVTNLECGEEPPVVHSWARR